MGIVDANTFHPRMLSDAVKIQAAEFEWLPAALENCDDGEWKSKAYVGYVSHARPNEPGSAWHYNQEPGIHFKVEAPEE